MIIEILYISMKQFSEGKWVTAEVNFAVNYWNFTDLSDYAVSQLWACWGVRAAAGVIVSIQQSSVKCFPELWKKVMLFLPHPHSDWLKILNREHGCAIPPVCLLTSC